MAAARIGEGLQRTVEVYGLHQEVWLGLALRVAVLDARALLRQPRQGGAVAAQGNIEHSQSVALACGMTRRVRVAGTRKG